MSDYRQDPPPDELIEMLFTENGKLYWKPEFCRKGKVEGKPIGSVDRYGYLTFTSKAGQPDKKVRAYKVHRVIHYLNKGEWPPVVDHIDRDRLNNVEDNLQSANNFINSQNREKNYDNNTGFLGVKNRNSSFSAFIHSNNEHLEISGYKTPEAAALARDILALLIHGKHANTNLIGKFKISLEGVEL
ncbi:HNH endonuclease [Salmonella enterica]|nr:hypothetical protein [Salmonella enterica]EIZ5832148.1 HNH endonuclease [Salmonella enterica]